jgi:hypothetical protein
MTMELHCSRDLALRLGAVTPTSFAHHRLLKEEDGHLLVRDEKGMSMFLPWALDDVEIIEARSS